MTQLCAVLTGDLIGSTEAGIERVEKSMEVLRTAAADLMLKTKSDTRFTRFRGDGWQIYLQNPGDFLWATVYLKAMLKDDNLGTLQTRIGIGLGTASGLAATDLSSASGTAFIHSGRALDLMMDGMTLDLMGEGTDDIQRTVIHFIDDLISGWTQDQAEAVSVIKSPRAIVTPGKTMTQGMVAEVLGISRQAVGARLAAAHYPRILEAQAAFRHHDWTRYA